MSADPFRGPFTDAVRGFRATQTRFRSASPAGVLLGIALFAIVGLIVLPILLIAVIGMAVVALVGVALSRLRALLGGLTGGRGDRAFGGEGRRNVRVIVKTDQP